MNDTEKQAISNIQRYLRQLSYTDPDIQPVPIDGIFSNDTRNALKAFQRKHSLTDSGVADRETFETLYAEYLTSLAIHSPPEPLPVFPRTPFAYELSLGDEYFAVSVLQLILNELRIIYDSFVPIIISGIYDEYTERNVTEFQIKNALPPTGRVDKATWDRLVKAYTNYAFDYVR